MAIILASTSTYRRKLLERLGLPFRVLAPGVDEGAFKDQGFEPRELAERLAWAKATSLARDWPEATLIGSDQLVAFEGRILGKPGTLEKAKDQLATLTGRTHELITALAVWHQGQVWTHLDQTRLTMRSLTLEEISRYVEADQPTDCAGSYKLEERGIALFDQIETEDHSAITGLPLIALTTILRRLGFPIP